MTRVYIDLQLERITAIFAPEFKSPKYTPIHLSQVTVTMHAMGPECVSQGYRIKSDVSNHWTGV